MTVETCDKLTATIPEVAQLLSVSRSHLYGLISSDRFGPSLIRLGRKVIVDRLELAEWIQAKCPSREKWQILKKDKL